MDEISNFMYERLKEIAKSSDPRITYGDLAKEINDKFNVNVKPHIELVSYLDEMNRIIFDDREPLISVLVVNKSTNKPGSGFYNLANELYGKNITDDEERSKVFEFYNKK